MRCMMFASPAPSTVRSKPKAKAKTQVSAAAPKMAGRWLLRNCEATAPWSIPSNALLSLGVAKLSWVHFVALFAFVGAFVHVCRVRVVGVVGAGATVRRTALGGGLDDLSRPKGELTG